MDEVKRDTVWAEEPGVQVTAEMSEGGGRVVLWIHYSEVDQRYTEPFKVVATLGRWRWDRLVKAMELPAPAQPPEGK